MRAWTDDVPTATVAEAVLLTTGINWDWLWKLKLKPDGTYHVVRHWREHRSEPNYSIQPTGTTVAIEDGKLYTETACYPITTIEPGEWIQAATHTKIEAHSM